MLYEKKKKIKRRKKQKTPTSYQKEQGEIHLSCWCSPSDFFLDSSLVFYQLRVLGWVIQLLATLPVSPSPFPRGNFCGNPEGEVCVSPLGGTIQSSGKIVGVFSVQLHLLSRCAPVYFQ